MDTPLRNSNQPSVSWRDNPVTNSKELLFTHPLIKGSGQTAAIHVGIGLVFESKNETEQNRYGYMITAALPEVSYAESIESACEFLMLLCNEKSDTFKKAYDNTYYSATTTEATTTNE